MYEKNPSGISYRVKTFLESLDITTTKLGRGRGRATSVKDVHSLRHTFAYLAGCYQIPLPVVQSILGHMSPEMTKHYQAHADREAKEKYLAKLPNFIGRDEVKAIGRQASSCFTIPDHHRNHHRRHLGFPDECEWGGLLFVVKDTGQVLWGNPPPLEYIHNGESPRKVPDEEFHEAAGYECNPPTQGR